MFVITNTNKLLATNTVCLIDFGSSSNSQLSFLRFLIISESDFFSAGERSLACNVYHFLISNNKYAGAVVSMENCLKSAFTFTISTLVSTFGSGSGGDLGSRGMPQSPAGPIARVAPDTHTQMVLQLVASGVPQNGGSAEPFRSLGHNSPVGAKGPALSP